MPHPTEVVAVRHPLTDEFIALNPAVDYDDDDILVQHYGWAFVKKDARGVVDSVAIEKATAAPGEKRSRSRG